MSQDKWIPRMLAAAVILVSVYFLALGAVKLANLWILIFGSVVVAVIVRAIADPLVARLKFKDGPAVLTAVLAIVAGLGAIGFLFGQQISEQVHQLSLKLPGAWTQLQTRLETYPAAGEIIAPLQNLAAEAGRALLLAPQIALEAVSGIATLVLVMVAGVFLAARPGRAREGVLCLAPKSFRPRLREVMNACGRALKGWLKAQLLAMLLVGSLVGLGLWAINVPAPLALAMVAGLAQFVPVVGPISAALPALLVAASGGAQMLFLTLILFVGVSQLEANLISPLVQKNVASLPIVLGIFAVVAFGTLLGPLGVLFATPLTLVFYTILTMLYRQDVLHDEGARAPGEVAP